MGAGDRVAESRSAPLLVLGEIPVEERDLALALEGEDVGGDAVEEPAVVGDHDHVTGELLEGILEGTQTMEQVAEVIAGVIEQSRTDVYTRPEDLPSCAATSPPRT